MSGIELVVLGIGFITLMVVITVLIAIAFVQSKPSQKLPSKHPEYKPEKNAIRFSVGDSSVFRFWVTGNDAYCSVRLGAQLSKISMHKDGVTLVNLGKQKQRIRLKDRVKMGDGWEVALVLMFPTIPLDYIEKSDSFIPDSNIKLDPAPLRHSKQLLIYSSLEAGLGPPPFAFSERMGPFIKRSRGEYWIYSQVCEMTEEQISAAVSARKYPILDIKQQEPLKVDAILLWIPDKDRMPYPSVVCLPVGRENFRTVSPVKEKQSG